MIRRPRRPTILAPTRHREYRLLFGAQVVSNLGDWLDVLALIALVLYRWGLGAGAWGAVLTAINVPGPLLGPFAGVWVDRWDRRTVMIVCDLARAVLVLGLVWAPNLITVVLLIAAVSSLSAFFQPAQQAAIRLTVPDDDLLAANALAQLSDNGARLVGPALGGLVVLVAGARGAFAVDAASFLVSAALLSRLVLPVRPPEPAKAVARSFWHDLRLGLSFLTRSPLLRLAV